MNADAPRSLSDPRASVAMAAVAFVVFVALPQRTFHGVDTDWYSLLVDAGELSRADTHVAYVPLCWLVFALMAPLGVGAVKAMLITSALGSALAVLLLHRAALRLPAVRHPTLVPIAVALTPACFYFATASEIPGVFAAGSAAAWWAFARWWQAPRLRAALLLGAICGAAATVHALGNLLSPMLVLTAFSMRRVGVARLAGHALLIAAAHGVVALSIPLALGHGLFAQAGTSMTMLAGWAGSAGLPGAFAALWREGVRSFLPWSALAVIALAVPGARQWAIVWLVALAVHAPVVAAFLSRGDLFVEQGAYLLPTALPAVIASLAILPRSWASAAIALAAALAVALVAPRWAPLYSAGFVEAAAQLRRERDVFFVVAPGELEGIRTHLGGTPCVEVDRFVASYVALAGVNARTPPLPEFFDATLVHLGAPRRACLVTREASRCFVDSPMPAVRALWTEHVPESYEQEPLQRPGLEGVFLRRR